jgi:hypothetical protein
VVLILALLLGAAALIYNAASILNGDAGLGGFASALQTPRRPQQVL